MKLIPQLKRFINNRYFLVISLILIAGGTYFFQLYNQKTPLRSFYFWKTTFSLTKLEKSTLINLKINKLYVKFFDIKLHPTLGFPIPIAKLKIKSKVPNHIEVVPVIYIVNKVLVNASKQTIEKLAKSIFKLSKEINNNFEGNSINEIQLDCDWTGSTKNNYFLLLKALKTEVGPIKLSSTLRLHQFANQIQTGIPPAESVSLMCYNLYQSNYTSSNNSILNLETLKTYFQTTQKYPLPTAIVLPIFSWTVVFRKSNAIGIIYNLNENETLKLPVLQVNKHVYKVLKGFTFKGNSFAQGDELKFEELTPKTVLESSKYLAKTLKESPDEIIFFDLNERYLHYNFTTNDLESIYNSFNVLPNIR